MPPPKGLRWGTQQIFRQISPEKWYIVDLFRVDHYKKPTMLKKAFDNHKQAQMSLDKFFKGKLRFDIIQGFDAIRMKMVIRNAKPDLGTYLHKYRYAADMMSHQERKSYRTKFRRQKRNKQVNGDTYKNWG